MPDPAPGQTEPDPNQPHRDIAKWTKAVAAFTACLFAVSGVADWFIYQQYRVANDAQKDTREQLRAIVKAVGGNISPAIIGGQIVAYQFMAHFHNFGGTRTNTFISWASVHLFEGDVPYSQDFSKPWNKVTLHDQIIPANAEAVLFPIGISAPDALAAKDGRGKVVVWGHVDWSDIFDKETIHHIQYCLLMQPTGTVDVKVPAPTPLNGSTSVAPTTITGIVFDAVPFRAECNTED